MVLFYDDEEKLKTPPTRRRRVLRLAFRIVMVFAVMCALSIGLLSALGGSGEALRGGAEDYLERVTGLEASIGEFRSVTFFPLVSASFGNVVFRGPEKGAQGGAPVARLGSFDFAMNFWDVFFSRGRIRALEVKDFHADAGTFAARAIDIGHAGIEIHEKEGAQARLAATGAYGGEPLFFSVDLEAHDIGGGLKDFRRAENGHVVLDLPFLKLDGTMRQPVTGGAEIQFNSIGAPEKIMEGSAALRRGDGGMKISLTLKGGVSTADADLLFQAGKITGSVAAPVFDLADLPLYLKLREAVAAFFAERRGVGFAGLAADIDLEIKELKHGGRALGKIAAPLHIAGETLTLAPVTGEIGGGKLHGDLSVAASTQPAILKTAGGLEKLPYDAMDESVLSGDADVTWSLESAAAEWASFPRNLKGHVLFVAGEGKMKSGRLDWWGGGVINAMLPDFSGDDGLTFNCAIADFKVDGGVARPDPLFVDTSRVTVAGEGEIDIPSRRVDLKLTPKAKELAVGTLTAVPVRVSGILPDIAARPDTFGLGSKLGTLLLGTVNPAFWVLSLTELGVGENHPCRKFIAAPEKKEE